MKKVKSILEFDDGSIIDQAQRELKKVLENIADLNTSTKAREITIKLSLTPDAKRKHIGMKACVTSKLQPTQAIETSMQLSMNDKEIVATELTDGVDGQVDLFGQVHM